MKSLRSDALSWRSTTTTFLKQIARRLPADSFFRRSVSRLWTRVLAATGDSIEVEVNGRTWNLRNRFRMMPPTYEPEAFVLWEKLLRPGAHVWDIGANIGLYSLVAGKCIGETGSILSWEPTPETFGMLSDHIRWNGYSQRCRLIQEAIGNVNSELEFSIEPDSTTNRLSNSSDRKQLVKVPVRTLDYWLDEVVNPPAVVKMDIEGAEVLAFQSSDGLLGKYRPRIVVAVHPQFAPEYGASVTIITEAIRRHSYRCFDTQGKETIPESYSEYLLLPEEDCSSVYSFFS